MDRQSYEDGRTGQAAGPNTNMDAYRAGQREADAGMYKPGWEGENKKSDSGGGWSPAAGSGPATGISFGLMIMAPFMYMVYPAGGLLALGIIGALVVMMNWLHVPSFTVMMSAIVLAFAAFFIGIWAERKVSQSGVYRAVRQGWRILVSCALLSGSILQAGGKDINSFKMDLLIKNSDQVFGAFVVTLISIVIAFWLIRKADRIYFPVESLLAEETQAKAGVKAAAVKPKGAFQRAMMSLVWLLPVALVTHLIIRLLIDGYFQFMPSESETEELRLDFYHKNLIFLYMTDIMVWLLLSIKGILPGTKKWKNQIGK